MKHTFSAALLLAGFVSVSSEAQVVDRSKYRDYDPELHPDYSLLEYRINSSVRNVRGAAGDDALPDHVNNAQSKYFPPVFNQAGGSCSPASRIGYMFTYELNAYRNLDGSRPENQYPSHFVWLLTCGNSGKDAFVKNVGVPNVPTYGGRTYSHLFGNQTDEDSDFGWMQGYDKWYSAMFNRMVSTQDFPVHVGTEEGRLAVKHWLYNHNGDPDFRGAGGIAGIGLASGGDWKPIPESPANKEAGVVGKMFVKRWGTSFDHAVTIVGYDDRIEFDLNGNGVIGEQSADEKGAWIIVNSWGKDWCNDGFIYCPYAYGGMTFTETSKGNFTFDKNFWYPEVYKVRKDYRPFRTMKIKMDYSRRSELYLSGGVSADLQAEMPDVTVPFEHFKYAGDGNYGNTNPAPEVPMLGKWADGKLHHEPMEFGYDLTDLSAGYDRSQPLKYFFIINTKDWAAGQGKIYNASIIDYEFDRAGVEVPFDLKGKEVQIQNKGNQTILSTIVYGESYFAPKNLMLTEAQLSWEKPLNSFHKLHSYNIYSDNRLIGEVGADALTFDIDPADKAIYSVSAMYEEGVESAKISVNAPVATPRLNIIADFKGSGFAIPDIFKTKREEATIEYWIRPNALLDWNQAAGPGWGDFLSHATANGQFVCGWDTGDERCTTNSGTLRVGAWTHIAIVVNHNKMTVYVNGREAASVTSKKYSGIGGWDQLRFREAEDNDNQNAKYDEIRIWNYARSADEILRNKQVQFSGQLLPQGLLAYYKGDTLSIDNKPYLRDCAQGHHAAILKNNFMTMNHTQLRLENPKGNVTASIVAPKTTVYAGVPVQLEAQYSENAVSLSWTAAGAGVKNLHVAAPSLVFQKAGKEVVELEVKNAAGQTAKATCEVNVEAAPSCDATFTMSHTSIPAGDRASFLVSHPVMGYQYSWSMPGAEVESAQTVNAASTYMSKGTYPVTLTVTSPEGKTATSTQNLSVVEVAPVADCEISPAIIVKGETTFLKDKSKYDPTQWIWSLKNEKHQMLVDGQHSSLTPETTGIFDLSLNVKNNSGSDTYERQRALIVCNADSKNGLFFSEGAQVTMAKSPIAANLNKFTIEYWMNPTKLKSFCAEMGDSKNTLNVKTDSKGCIAMNIGHKRATCSPGFIIAGEWHHYAIVLNGVKVYFYRDGVEFEQKFIGRTTVPHLDDFHIGGSTAPLLGQLDEFRIWERSLSEEELRTYANAPIADVTKAEGLSLYYNFNQNGGEVIDATSNHNNGVRTGFGPDGDAWSLSSGVFCLNFEGKKSAEDVTSTYLKNYKTPFKHANVSVNDNVKDRFFEISDWTLENAVFADGITTGVHVDAAKENSFTYTSTWDGFSELKDHKVYQTVKLPAGAYTFKATYADYGDECDESYVVVAEGKGLPNTENVLGASIASVKMQRKSEQKSPAVSFVLTQDTEVSLGLLINQSGKRCCTIHNFQLVREPATVYEADQAAGFDLTVDQSGYNTLYLPYPTVIPEGVTAYVASEVKGNELLLEPILDGILPAKTGVVVTAAAGQYHFSPSTVSSPLTSLLRGTLEETETDAAQRYYTFDAQSTPGFYLYNGSSLPANRAYLVTDANDVNEVYYINLTSVGIEGIQGDRTSAPVYDLSGRRVAQPAQGIYISNGKKVLVK